jgi:hypothetical protein
LSSTKQTPTPAFVLPPQDEGSCGAHCTLHTAKFGIAAPPSAVTWTHAPVLATPQELPGLSQNAWHVPKMHVRPCAHPAVAVHGFPIAAFPNATHFAVPIASTTSHVSFFAHPH